MALLYLQTVTFPPNNDLYDPTRMIPPYPSSSFRLLYALGPKILYNVNLRYRFIMVLTDQKSTPLDAPGGKKCNPGHAPTQIVEEKEGQL